MAFPGRIEGQGPVSERAPSFVKGSVQLPMLGYEVGPTRPTEKGGITMSIFNGLAAAGVIGLAGLLLSPSTFANVSMGSDPAVQQLHRGTLLAEAADGKKTTKAKTKAVKAKKPATKSKVQDKGTVSTPLTPGEYR
jgi:hypothetical protein